MSSRGEYQDAVRAVVDLLAEHDPEGLVAAGAPHDEYDPEARDLARVILSDHPITAETLAEVWDLWFGPSGFVESARRTQLDQFASALDALRLHRNSR